jgi:serine/threonine protein kinase
VATLEDIFLAAVEKAQADRAAYLDTACGSDAGLRAQVEALLRSHEEAGSLLEQPLFRTSLTADEPPAVEHPGVSVGPYKLLELIGEGGMGSVWMAQQTEPVKRVVALKLIKAGMDSKQVIARFEAERQALALMDHANIARVLDAGTTSTGRPYFVMDLVKGIPITKYCDEHRLTPRQRLELLIPVCQAVQHAHQKGIIHRDLKPSNVLVALYDGKPVPKVIDFGVAKAAGQSLTDKTLVTGFGNIVGTLEYMSPEQAEINQLDIDTRSDIYSLGVLLYELLTGSPPFTKKEFEKAGMLEMLRVIREQEPSKPSTKLSTAEGLPTLAANRGTEPAKLTKLVRGELDWIVMKALEKDRNRRYDTANGLAVDVLRYLADEPVEAGPPSARYRLRKFLRRNRGPVLAVTVVLLVLIAGAAVSIWQAVRATQAESNALAGWASEAVQRQQANVERERAQTNEAKALNEKKTADAKTAEAESVLKFFQWQVLAAARPKDQEGGLGITATIREAVDAAEPRIAKDFKDQPAVEASIRHALGETYWHLGEANLAIRQIERGLELDRSRFGPEHENTLVGMNNLAALYRDAGRFSQAVQVYKETWELLQTKLGPEHPTTLICANNLAHAYLSAGRPADALALCEQTVPLMKSRLGPRDPNTLTGMTNLASAYEATGRSGDALALEEEIVRFMRAELGVRHPNTLRSMNNLAEAYRRAVRLDESIALNEETLELRRAVLGKTHPDTLSSMNNLALAYWAAGRRERSLKLQEETLEATRAKLGPEHPLTLRILHNVAWSYQQMGRPNDAVPLFEQVLTLRLNVLGADHPDTLGSMRYLSLAYRASHRSARGEPAKALPLVNDFLASQRKRLAPGAPELGEHLARAGYLLLSSGAFGEAESILRECVAIRQEHSPDHARTFNARSMLGGSLLGQKKYTEAEPLLVQGYEGMKQRESTIPAQNRGLLVDALERLVELYDAWEKPDKAAPWRTKLENQKKSSGVSSRK